MGGYWPCQHTFKLLWVCGNTIPAYNVAQELQLFSEEGALFGRQLQICFSQAVEYSPQVLDVAVK